jgi:DNA helicase-2/ATP-dependent DNA helicase PcrA
MESAFLRSLNERQREACLITEGPLMVLAGAGSGKTKMLTSRIAWLVEGKRVQPQNILAVTFTNKAAHEMRERVSKILQQGNSFGVPEIGTFHAICVRLLRRELGNTPFTQTFTIYDDSDQLSLIKDSVSRLGIDEKQFSAKSFQAAINRAKCDAVEPHEMEIHPHNFFEKQVKRVYEQYQKDLFANNAIDFGEILTLTYRLLRDNPEVRARWQNRFRYIHVDEYQDTNRAQYLLLSILAGRQHGGHENICVVGDEDQSIYKWRGADIKNILDFERDYPGAKVVKLEQNYRSTQTIIRAASDVISNNTERKDKRLWTENPVGGSIIRAHLPDERAEADFVVRELKRLAEREGKAYSEFAILYRTHAQSRQFEDVFRREKIAYQIVGGLRFYDRKEIKDVLCYFKLLQNPTDSISLKRVLNVPARGIGKTTLEKLEGLQQQAQNRGDAESTLWATIKREANDPHVLSSGTAKKILGFVNLIERLKERQPRLLLSELYHLLLDETGYVRELRSEGTDEALERIENLEEFDTLLQEFEEDFFSTVTAEEQETKRAELLAVFLEQSSLASENNPREQQDLVAVQMMSLHGCKGLEFPVVFLVGMEEGLFPSVRPWEETPDAEIEEERRLCYVGMTRAREYLYLSSVSMRRLWGQMSYPEPARFFAEMPPDAIEFRDFSHGGLSQSGASRSAYGSSGGGWDSSSTHSSGSSSGGYGGGKPSGGYGYGGGKAGAPKNRSDDDFDQSPAQDDWGQTGRESADALVGLRVAHPDYGAGRVVLAEGGGENTKVVVDFGRGDKRKFLFRFIRQYVQA